MTADPKRKEEIERNYRALEEKLPELLKDHRGEFLLMRAGEIVGFFQNAGDALAEGQKRFKDGQFSVQEVVEEPVDLGFFSHAIA